MNTKQHIEQKFDNTFTDQDDGSFAVGKGMGQRFATRQDFVDFVSIALEEREREILKWMRTELANKTYSSGKYVADDLEHFLQLTPAKGQEL